MIALVNYEIGNIGSLKNAFNYLGESVEIVSNPQEVDRYDALVLPGVGAFDTAMTSLKNKGFVEPLKKFVGGGKPLLGICLGLQVLCRGSEEGKLEGLGLIPGTIRGFRSLGCKGKVPHVGFNEMRVDGKPSFLTNTSGKDFYFVHSFALPEIDVVENASIAKTSYEGVDFISALQVNNIFATQFHPEKSGDAGIQLLSEFVACSKSV